MTDDMKEVAKALMAMVNVMNRTSDICPQCGAKIETMKQIGRCAYAEPCGCRLWQGKVGEAWKK